MTQRCDNCKKLSSLCAQAGCAGYIPKSNSPCDYCDHQKVPEKKCFNCNDFKNFVGITSIQDRDKENNDKIDQYINSLEKQITILREELNEKDKGK